MTRHPFVSRKFVKGEPCQHEWAFTKLFRIRCAKCRITAVRRPSKAEMREFKVGGWIYLEGRKNNAPSHP